MTLMPSWYNYYRFDGPEPLVNGDVPSMPFPSIRRNFPRVEILISNITSAVEMAESFTNANAHRQGLINGGVTSPFIPGTGSLNNSDYQMLSTADQVVLWFDGISGGEFADVAYMYFRDFVLNQTTWTQSARALDNLATELYQSTTPRPLASVDLSRSRRSGNSTTAFFIDQAVVVLTPTTGNALIYYTIDGAEPIAGTSTLTFNSVTFQIKAGCAFGTCVDDDQCQCSALHHNVLFSNCTEEIPQEFSSHSTVIGAVITAVNAILMSAYIFIGVVFVIYFNHKVLRAATSMSMILIVVGCLLGCSAIFFVIQKPTEFTCNARHWFASSGFGLIWGNILAKGYPNTTIFLWSGAIVAIEIMLSLIYTLLNGPKPVLIRRTGFLEWTCQSQNESFDLIMIAAFVGYNALLIIGGVIIAVITRNVASDYNESQILGYTTFTFTIVTVVTIPIFAVPGLSYTIRFVLFACIIFLLTESSCSLSLKTRPVSPTSLKGKDKAALKDGETKTETHLVTKLFCMPPGVASRWIECMIIRHPLQDLLLVANHERGTGIMTAKVSQCVTSKGVTVVTAILQSAGKQSLKVQASDEETLRNLLVMPAGAANVGKSAGQSSAGQNSSVGQRESVKVGTVRTSAITE
ncbi:7 transmembrane sweet-taste receptor of 3 GCPR-domain-containing protein [Chytridium lagenaria]|nr:7 transmembrane sweet-taste receptor of 3 GCPR-domain-containing protein [Chytridium lagenaria]